MLIFINWLRWSDTVRSLTSASKLLSLMKILSSSVCDLGLVQVFVMLGIQLYLKKRDSNSITDGSFLFNKLKLKSPAIIIVWLILFLKRCSISSRVSKKRVLFTSCGGL
uniref:Uncharacterized protein n=1 Tax=Cacopsylla melanoneura TaxID=428564 RepID=A0A8D8YYM7_9HEMI